MSDNSSKITTIVGAQWGDEGKGKITDFFARESDYVVRFHGGNNAGHTVIVDNKTYKINVHKAHIPTVSLGSLPSRLCDMGKQKLQCKHKFNRQTKSNTF